MADPDLELLSERLRLTLPEPELAFRVVDYFLRNRAYHAPWSPPYSEAFFTLEHWKDRLAVNRREASADSSLRFFIGERADPERPVRGHLSFTRFIRGPFQACLLGYALDEAVVGKGYMHEALTRAIEHVFAVEGLHRIEANYVPTNERSGALLRRLGFEVQGYARDYLFIAGSWRDHVLTAKTNPNPQAPAL